MEWHSLGWEASIRRNFIAGNESIAQGECASHHPESGSAMQVGFPENYADPREPGRS
jgi:hypothetical protein